jgi:peroxiredoxin
MPRVVVPRTAKQAFISLFSSVPPLLAVDAVRRAIRARRGDRVGWVLAAAVHALPGAYFANGFLRPAARTSPNLVGLQVGTGVGVALGLRFAAALAIGAMLPGDLRFTEHGHGPIAAADLRGQPTVWLFYRGNWCPLCMAQVGEIAARWRDVEALGAQVVLVSPQDEAHTRSLAARHGVAFRYLRDEGLEAARRLGIANDDGTPAGMIGYESDTVLPTLVVTDGDGRIAYADQTDNYRVRPTPDTVLAALRGIVDLSRPALGRGVNFQPDERGQFSAGLDTRP